MSCFRGKEPALGPPPHPHSCYCSLLHHPRAGGGGSWRHQSPGLPPHVFPRRRRDSAQSPRWPLLARPAAQQRGLCDPLTAAVPWRQRPADRRPPCQQHDRCRPALPGSAPGAVTRAGPAHRPALGRGLSSAGLEVCRPFPAPPGWPPPSCPPRLFRKGTHLSPWPGESREPSAHSPQPGYPRGPRPR